MKEIDILKEMRNNFIVSNCYRHGKAVGLSEIDTLKLMVKTFVELENEAFQEKLDEMQRSVTPLIIPKGE